MISESQMQYGSLVRRHGRSRWNWRNQPSSCFRNVTRSPLFCMVPGHSRTSEWDRHSWLSGYAGPSRKRTGPSKLRTGKDACPTLLRRIFEEDDVGGTPNRGGDRAVGLASHNDFEKVGRGGQLGHECLIRVRRQGLLEREVAQHGEDEVSCGSESSFHGCAAELQ